MVYKLYEFTHEEVKIVEPEIGKVFNELGITAADYERMSIEELSKIEVGE